jgi:hypothetical protein
MHDRPGHQTGYPGLFSPPTNDHEAGRPGAHIMAFSSRQAGESSQRPGSQAICPPQRGMRPGPSPETKPFPECAQILKPTRGKDFGTAPSRIATTTLSVRRPVEARFRRRRRLKPVPSKAGLKPVPNGDRDSLRISPRRPGLLSRLRNPGPNQTHGAYFLRGLRRPSLAINSPLQHAVCRLAQGCREERINPDMP